MSAGEREVNRPCVDRRTQRIIAMRTIDDDLISDFLGYIRHQSRAGARVECSHSSLARYSSVKAWEKNVCVHIHSIKTNAHTVRTLRRIGSHQTASSAPFYNEQAADKMRNIYRHIV